MRELNSKQKKTFGQILNTVAQQNAGRLIERAEIANRIAKSLRRQARANAYAIKTEALLALSTKFPDKVAILSDIRTPRYVLVKCPIFQFALHAPADRLAAPRAA